MYYYHLLFLSKPEKIPYHTSILTGGGWMLELLNGHPDRIKTSLGVTHNVFDALIQVLIENGFKKSCRGISVEEQPGISLHTRVTGLSTRHVGERFQHSPTMISRYVLASSLHPSRMKLTELITKIFQRYAGLFLIRTILYIICQTPHS